LRSLQANLPDFEARGVRLVAITSDPPAAVRKLRDQAGYTFTFLCDEKVEVIRQYDLLDAGAGPGGTDIARPAEFYIDPSGTVRWRFITPSYAARATPEQILKGIDAG
jgi:mycoredoxin-dependent peroxiredoxin